MKMTIRGLGLSIVAALAIFQAPSVAAQKATAESCAPVTTYQQGPDTYRRITNNCGENIQVLKRVSNVAGTSCGAQQARTLTTTSPLNQENITHGGRFCIQYQSTTSQANSCRAACAALADCGNSHGVGAVPLISYGATLSGNAGNIVLTPASGTLSFNEGSSGTFQVKLSAAPSCDTTVTLSKTNSGVTISPATLTFTASNYNTNQTVTVSSADDNDHQDISDTITLSASGGLTASNVTKAVSVDDQDTGGFDTGSATIQLTEGGSNTRSFSIRLDSAPDPGGLAKIGITSSDTGAVTVSPSELQFSSSTWNINNSVQVRWVGDEDGSDESVTISISPTSGYSGVAAITRSVTVRDNDGSITVSSAAVNVTEGATGTFTVQLGAPPSSSAVLSVSSNDTGAATVSPSSLTFSMTNWNSPQTVTVTGTQDNDESDENVTITVGTTSGYRASSVTKAVSVTDDDARVEVSSAAVSITEGGSTGTFTVNLSSAPSSNVTVSVLSGDTGAVTVSPSSINFTTTDFDAETVTVTAVADSDGTDESVTITLDATGTIPSVTKTITVQDDDGGITASAAAVSITEGGSAGTFTVTLDAPPKSGSSHNTTVSVTSGDTGAVTVSPASLTFSSTNSTSPQTVTVTPVSDADGLDESPTITLAASGGGYRASNETKTITVADDDRGIEVSSTAVSITEGGTTGTFTVELETAPAAGADATFSVTSGDAGAVTVSPATLTFTASNYDTAQTVTLTSVEDADGLDETVTITVSDTANYDADDATKSVSIVDDDRSIVASAAPTLTEGGSTGTFTVELETPPAQGTSVTVSVTSGDTGAATVAPATMTFTASDYDTAQTVTVTPVIDDDAVDESVTVTLSAGSGYDTDDKTVSVPVTDKDEAEFTLDDATNLNVVEEDATGVSFKVRLATRPSSNMTVSITATNSDIVIDTDPSVTGSQTSMSFAQFGQTNAWNQYRTVTLTATGDADTDSEHSFITITGAGSDYDGLEKIFRVSIEDDDIPPGDIVIAPPGTTLTIEEGQSKNLDITLSAPPVFDVTVDLSNTNTGVVLSPTSLTFTVSNYSRAQTVAIAPAQDDDAIDETDTITLSATGGLVAADQTLSVSVTDDETAGFELNTDTLTLIEGKQTYFLARLTSRPSADVTVTVTPVDPISIDTDANTDGIQNTLTFGQTDQANAWNRYQRVVVVANRDDDEDDETFNIALSSAGGDYQGKTGSIAVEVADVPPGDIVLLPAGSVSIHEGGSRRQIDISLSNAPNAQVTVSLSNTNPDVRLDRDSLTFTPSNYSQAQALTIYAIDDGDGVNDTDTIILSAAGGLFALPTTMEVTIIDDEAPPPPGPPPSSYEGGLTISPSEPYAIVEGGRITLTLSLDSQPPEDVTVTMSKTIPDLSIVPSTLTFTPTNWDAEVEVDIIASEDERAVDSTDNIVFSIPGRTLYTLALSIEDNDARLIPLPAGGIETPEGGTGTFRLKLSRMPPHNVHVDLSSRNDFVSVDPTSLTFTRSNWDSEMEVKVRGKEDLDSFDDYDAVLIDATGGTIHFASMDVSIIDNDEVPEESPNWEVKSKALAIPSNSAQDSATVRVRCDQETPCKIYLDCSTQAGEVLQGYLPAIPARATSTLVPGYIQRHIGSPGSWEGRLGCSLRSQDNIGSQVWTRSGDGVLVNNSEVIRSVMEGEYYRADIESIPSPDAFDLSNIRIRCEPQTEDCTETVFVCYTDEGRRYEAQMGAIARGVTRHLQAEELANLLSHRWPGIGLSCEVRSKGRFTAQILTRTGGGGALVNNSATGAMR